MNIPLLYLLERMEIEADVSAVASDALVRSVQLADRALSAERAPESGVLYIGSALPTDALTGGVAEGTTDPASSLASGTAEDPPISTSSYFLLNSADQAETPGDAPETSPTTWNGAALIVAEFDVYEAFNRAVDICFSFQEWTERFNELLEDAGNADALMRKCSAIFGNAAYMVDSAFKVIAIDDSQLFCEISSIWKHLVEEGYLLYDIVYSMQTSHQLEMMTKSSGAEICESEYFNNPFINYNMSADGMALGHFFVVEYQKRITPGEIALANLLGRQLASFVERFGLSQKWGAPYETFIARLMEDAPMRRVDIARQIAPWGWSAEDTLCVLAISEETGGVSLQDILLKQLSHELDMKSIEADGVIVGIAKVGGQPAHGHRSFEELLGVFLESHHCIAGMSDTFKATSCAGVHFRQAKAALTCLKHRPRNHAEPLFMRFNDCFTESLARTLRDEGLVDGFSDNRISALIERDLSSGTEYVRTLEMYLKCERRLNETANRLFVHRNTLLYRIGRINEMLGCDLGNPETRMRLLFSIENLKDSHDTWEAAL